MIGDHFQLRPTPSVYDLAVKYNFDVSLFERLFNNNIPSKCLEVQHRMRSSIAHLLVPEFYNALKNHASVLKYEDVAGVSSNIFFFQHSKSENDHNELKSHSNIHEALFVINFCKFLISQEHKPSSITILTSYVGQLHLIKRMQSESDIKDILVTTVDNYQGEENDIIIISFVRSNLENKIGFIKTSNRICVALSRARKGLYCIGNFRMFAKNSEIWQSLINKLTQMNCFGESMTVHCHKHLNSRFLINSPDDFYASMQKGCNEVCHYILPCKHTCTLLCHRKEIQHENSLCNNDCKNKCKLDIYWIEKDEENSISDDDPSTENENLIFIEHKHSKCTSSEVIETINDLQVENFKQYDTTHGSSADEISIQDHMQNKVTTLPCGHTKMLPCGMVQLNAVCEETITSVSKCGRNLIYTCGEESYHLDCTCPIALPCGHLTSCEANIKIFKCGQITDVTLPCGHVKSLMCYETKAPLKCTSKIDVILPCKHLKNISCCEKENLEKIKCELPCNYLLECGHNCQIMCDDCYNSKNSPFRHCCNVLVETQFSCGHTVNIPCQNTRSLCNIKCKEICLSVLKCGHKCSQTCDMCIDTGIHVICQVSVTKTLSCGHVTEVPCRSLSLPILCYQRCKYSCTHSQCINPCYVKCFPCEEPCSWNCSHHHCDKLCYELCERPPCNEPCPKRYDICHHFCPGFCGEPCPKECLKCKGFEIPTQGAVLLEDCNHLVSADELSAYLNDCFPKTFPNCPQCSTTITRNIRFSNVLKKHRQYQFDNECENTLSDSLKIIEFFKPWVNKREFMIHIETLLQDFQMRTTLESECFELRLKRIRQIDVLFCLNKCYEMFNELWKVKRFHDSAIDLEFTPLQLRKFGEQLFKDGVLFYIERMTSEKIFSKFGKINELIEDVESCIKQSPFDIKGVQEIFEQNVNTEITVHCPIFQKFYQFTQDLYNEVM